MADLFWASQAIYDDIMREQRAAVAGMFARAGHDADSAAVMVALMSDDQVLTAADVGFLLRLL